MGNNEEKLNLKGKSNKLTYFRTRKNGEEKPITRKVKDKNGNEIEQEYLQQLDERVYFEENMIKNLDLDTVGTPGMPIKDGYYFQVNHYLIKFWGRFLKSARLVYDVLRMHGNKSGNCYVSVKTLAGITGMSDPTITKHLDTLEHYGFIYRVFCESTKDGSQEASFYKIRTDTHLLTQDLINKLPENLQEEHEEYLSKNHPVFKESILKEFDYVSAYEELLSSGKVRKAYKELTEEERERVSRIRLQNIKNKQTIFDITLWDDVLEILRVSIAKPTLDTWFKDVTCLLVDERLELYTEHQGIAEHLEERFMEDLEIAAKRVDNKIESIIIKSM